MIDDQLRLNILLCMLIFGITSALVVIIRESGLNHV